MRSGRKFKLCCGLRAQQPARTDTRNTARGNVAAVPMSALSGKGADPRDLGLWAEAVRVREAAERFRQNQFGPPAALFDEKGATERVVAERLRQRGALLFEAGKLGAAVAALRQSAELDPGHFEAHYALGRAFLHEDRLAEAIDSLELATILKDDFAAAHHDLAVALHGLDVIVRQSQPVAAPSRWRRLRRAIVCSVNCLRRAAKSWKPLHASVVPHLPRARQRRAGSTRPSSASRRQPPGSKGMSTTGHHGRLRKRRTLQDARRGLGREGRFKEAREACDRALD